MKELKISQLLRAANIRKAGISAHSTSFLHFYIAHRNLPEMYIVSTPQLSQQIRLCLKKNTYHRFLNNRSFNWFKFLFLLSERAISCFTTWIPEIRNVSFDRS